jgi:predicted GNAT family N-acyltransferase
MTLKIELLDSKKHDRGDFSCGQESLDTYIRKQASQDLKRKVATVFVLIDEPNVKVLAFYTLSAYTVNVLDLQKDFMKSLPRYPSLPATLLGRLGVDQSQKGQRFGELMLVDALRQSLEVSKQVASLAVIAEALNDAAVSFYQKYGFQQFQQEQKKLYLPMKSIALLYNNHS